MKEVNARKMSSLARKILRILGMDRGFVRSSGTQEEESIRVNIPVDYSNSKSIETAFLEAERKKAEPLIEWKKRSCIC